MCGHVGIAGNMTAKDEKLIRNLLLIDYLRGPDSTGLAAIRDTTQSKAEIAKIASHPLDLFDTIRFKNACNGYQSKAFIGHNRAATRGVVNNVNAHPYQYGHITGAHNGTLDLNCVRDMEMDLNETFEVDSMAIFRSLEVNGVEETISELEGAWALVWYDQKEDTLNFIRNDQRTLWYAMSKDMKQFFWASEWKMLNAAMDFAGGVERAVEVVKDKDGEHTYSYFPFDTDTLYTIPLQELKKGYTALPDFRVKEIKGREPKPVASAAGKADPFGRTTGVASTSTGQTCTTMKSHGSDNKPPVTVFHLCDENTPYGNITPTEFAKLAAYGCSWCSADIEWGDEGVEIYEKEDAILCATCANHSDGNTRIHTTNMSNIIG